MPKDPHFFFLISGCHLVCLRGYEITFLTITKKKTPRKTKPQIRHLHLSGASLLFQNRTLPVRLLLPLVSSQAQPEPREGCKSSLFKTKIFLLPGKPQITSPAAPRPVLPPKVKGVKTNSGEDNRVTAPHKREIEGSGQSTTSQIQCLCRYGEEE